MKMQMLVVGLLVLSGCASIEHVPPAQRELDRSRTYEMDFETTWTRAVDWYADHNVTIEKIEKNSGLLTARYLLAADSSHLDCGQIKAQGTLGEPTIERYGSLNLTVRPVHRNATRVNVNFFGNYDLKARDAWDGRNIDGKGRCVSTGELERQVLDYIGGR